VAGRYVASDKSEEEKPASNGPGKTRVAAFDFDSTIIKTISKAKFSRDANDWCWWHGSVPGKLKELHSNGYRLVIMSNQSGISLRLPANAPKVIKDDRLTQFKKKAAAVFNNLNLPISVYAATERDRFRKPNSGMWGEFLKDHGLVPVDVDLKNSIFVGDAGGRKGDFACSDRNFATNVGIEFKTPEEFFLDQPSQPYSRSFEPSKYIVDLVPETNTPVFKPSKGKEIILFVGTPGAGKSTFYHRYLEPLGYVRINQDILKSVSVIDRSNLDGLVTCHREKGV
jgi:bifunctional polynucleotide phosphatase/kinase